jgi:monoamine oxidase
MAKSELAALLRRHLRLAMVGVQHNISTTELIERDEAGREAAQRASDLRQARQQWSRREFLTKTATAAVGAAFLSSLSRDALAFAQQRRVVVVGAGLAGTIAALRLTQARARVDLYEASKRTGGRTYTLRSFFPNQIAELGGELVDSGHATMQALLKEFGNALVDMQKVDEKVEKEVYFFNGARVDRTAILDEFRPVAEAIIGDLKTISGDITYGFPSNAQLLDNLSIAEWLDKRGISGNIRALLASAYIAEYGTELDQQSSLNMLQLIGTDMGEQGDQFEIFGASDERFRIREGSDNLARKMVARLRRPPITESVLEAVKPKDTGGYVLTFSIRGKSTDVEADDVVLAIPFTALRNVDLQVEMPPLKKQAIAELGYGVNTKLMLGFGSQMWRKAGSSGSVFTDLPFQNSWETSRGQGNTNGILTSFSGGQAALAMGEGEKKDKAQEFLAQAAQVFPGLEKAYTGRHERFAWGTYEFTQGSYSAYRPGQMTRFRGVEAEPVGRIFFAGEHTSLVAQGYMEGAAESGERVAKELLATQ